MGNVNLKPLEMTPLITVSRPEDFSEPDELERIQRTVKAIKSRWRRELKTFFRCDVIDCRDGSRLFLDALDSRGFWNRDWQPMQFICCFPQRQWVVIDIRMKKRSPVFLMIDHGNRQDALSDLISRIHNEYPAAEVRYRRKSPDGRCVYGARIALKTAIALAKAPDVNHLEKVPPENLRPTVSCSMGGLLLRYGMFVVNPMRRGRVTRYHSPILNRSQSLS